MSPAADGDPVAHQRIVVRTEIVGVGKSRVYNGGPLAATVGRWPAR